MGDSRPGLIEALDAFGVPVTATPTYSDTWPAVSTTGVWLPFLVEPQPFGTDLKRRDPRKVLVVSRAAMPFAKRGQVLTAPELEGDTVKTWRIDEIDRTEIDCFRLILIEVTPAGE